MKYVVALLACCSLNAEVIAQQAPRTYRHDRIGKDLSNGNYAREMLDDTDFSSSRMFLTNFTEASLVNCNLQSCDMTAATFTSADLTGSDLRLAIFDRAGFQKVILDKADLSGCDLYPASFQHAKFIGANLRNLRSIGDITGADFTGADLRGANLGRAIDYQTGRVTFHKAKYDNRTKWPSWADPKTAGAVYEELPPEPAPEVTVTPAPKTETTPMPANASPTKQFAELDINEDGILSGKEARGFEAFDSDKNGTISNAEYVAGTSPKPAVTPTPDATPGPSPFEKEFTTLDLNEDGLLSGKEARPFVDFDADQDGEITKAEFIAGKSKGAKP